MEVRVRFEPWQREVRIDAGTSLLEAARQAELPVASACGADGLCARCAVEILAGAIPAETGAERRSKQRNRVDPHLRLACCVAPDDDLVVTAPYW